MQMVKDGKECILRFFGTIEKLHIIDDQYINQLIEMDEIIDGIIAAVINKLVDKFF